MEKSKTFKIQWRVILTALAFVVQILLLFLMVFLLQHDFIWMYSIFELIGIVTVIYIVNKRGNPSYKIAWILMILALPVFGLLVYMFWGGQRTPKHLKDKMNTCKEHYMPYIKQDKNVEELIDYENNILSRHTKFLYNESQFPVYTNTNIEYLAPGEIFYKRFLEELEKAQKYIFIEFFIIAEGKMWDGIKDILYKKAKTGVEIKIIFDDFGSIKRQSKNFVKNLEKEGISVAVFNPIKPPFHIFFNNRNHRKLVVIDGNIAFTGGINIGDEYINQFERFGYWMDNAVLIEGKAVNSFVVMFAVMWEYITNYRFSLDKYLLSKPYKTDSYTMPYCDGPMDTQYPAQGIYTQILNTAHKYVYITTPYLVLDSNMTTALVMAAKSGIDVRIITPHIPDKKYVHPVTQFHYTELLEAGVRIFEFKPGFIHAKMFISDDTLATVGSVNMDFRSFVFHFECGVWFTESAAIGEMKAHFKSLCDESIEIDLKKWKKRSVLLKLKEWLLHIFAPLL